MKAESTIEYRFGEPMPGTRWIVRGKLGHGGMGVVLDVLKEDVIQGAMKVLHPRVASDPEFVGRFLEEFRVTARLQHANIVQVLDFDRLADGTPFMVMERLRGRTLGAALREARQRNKPWAPAIAYQVASQVAEGLYQAHSHLPSIVHRDIKPDNVFLHRPDRSLDAVVKVMDFGVAAVVGEREQRLIGTPRYMAPEQADGGPVSPQTDQYALGLLIYEMLTGRLPWETDGRNPSVMAEVRRRVPPVPPSRFCSWLPARIEAAILKALSTDPAARHETVHGLLFELRGLQPTHDESARGAEDNTNTTQPMVGTLAEAGLGTHDEDVTVMRMSAPPVEGPPLEPLESTAESTVSEEITRTWERAAGEAPSAPQSGVVPLSPSASQARDGFALDAPPAGGDAPGGSVDTPMGSASGPSAEHPRPAPPRALPRRLLGLGAAAVGVLVLWAGLRIAASARDPVAKVTGAATGVAVAGTVAVESNPSAEAAQAVDRPAELAEPGWLGPAVLAAASASALAHADDAPSAAAVRKLASPAARPALRAAPAKPRIPDDGRDELYIPEAR